MWCSPSAVLSLALVLSLSGFIAPEAAAQCTQSDQIFDMTIGPVGGDTVSRLIVRPGLGYEMRYDSCRVIFRVDEIKKNGSPIYWRSWCRGRELKSLSNSAASDSSLSVDFVVAAGDTISFHRDLAWLNPNVEEQTNSNFYALDSLDYSVALEDATSGSRIALLDSIGVLRRVPPAGAPVLHGDHAIIAVIAYVVPTMAQVLDTVRIRVRPYSRGDGPYKFIVHNRFGIGLSERLVDTMWQNYLANLGGGLSPKISPRALENSLDRSVLLEVSPNPTNSGTVVINFSAPFGGGSTAVAIYDESGQLLFIPRFEAKSNGYMSATYFFERSGPYFVGLYHEGALVRSVRIIVSK